jgi:hypothetical protein
MEGFKGSKESHAAVLRIGVAPVRAPSLPPGVAFEGNFFARPSGGESIHSGDTIPISPLRVGALRHRVALGRRLERADGGN